MANETILVVEDENIVAFDIQLSLQQLGYCVPKTASSSEEVFSAISEKKPDLILMDIQIKGHLDGIDTAKIVWEKYHIPIVFITAFADEKTLSRAKMAEPFGYILKPFDDLELRTVIEVTLEKARSIQQNEKRNEIERKANQVALQNTKDIFYSIMNFAPVIVFVKDLDGKYIHVNEQFLKVIKVGKDDVLGKTDFDFFDPELAFKYRENDNFVLINERPHQMEETINEEGHVRTYLSTKFPIKDSQGRMYALGGILNDITERKQIEAQRIHLLKELQETIKTREEFISLASHELRTPLTSIKLKNQMTLKSLRKENVTGINVQKLIQSLEFVEAELCRINRIIEDILDISRIKNKKIFLEKSHIHLASIVDDAIRENLHFFQAAGIDVVADLDFNIEGDWDSARIKQVINIMFSNAIKYAPNKPIEVKLKKIDRLVEFSVKDHGRGIPKKDHRRIFNCFERAIGTINISGLGIGLYIANYIVNRHGGKITVKSKVGEGANFILKLPLHEFTQQSEMEHQGLMSDTSSKG